MNLRKKLLKLGLNNQYIESRIWALTEMLCPQEIQYELLYLRERKKSMNKFIIDDMICYLYPSVFLPHDELEKNKIINKYQNMFYDELNKLRNIETSY